MSVGVAAGLLFAGWASRALVSLLPAGEGAASIDLPIDLRVFAFTAAVAGFAVALVGAAPAVYASRVPPIEGGGWSYAMWARLRERSDAFDGAFAWALQRLDLSEGGAVQAPAWKP